MSTKWYDNAVMINRDPNWYHYIDDSSAEACRESMEKYFSLYEGKLTDVCLGILEQTAMIPSKSFMWRGEKYFQKKENGHDVDYSETTLKKLYRCFAEYNVDAVQIFIDQVKKLGIRPWIALRMNDAHFGDAETSFVHSDMFYEENTAGHSIGSKYGYFGHCFDFSYPRYRNAILGYIGEILDKYDFFGLELDFMREIRCFDYLDNKDCHRIMTEYVREIKKLVSAAEKRVGHDIKISLRTCRCPVDAKDFGFDVKTLCDEGLIDVVIPTPRWSPTDSGIPVRQWRELLGEDIAIMGGIETNNYAGTTNLPKHSKAYAASFYAQGADGIYYNNHEYYTERNIEAWNVNRDTCLTGLREFVVLGQDCYAYNDRRYKPLPLEITGTAELPLELGKIKNEDKVTVVVNFEGAEFPVISVGGKADLAGSETETVIFKKNGVEEPVSYVTLSYDVSGIITDSALNITFKGQGTVHYVNVIIDAK